MVGGVFRVQALQSRDGFENLCESWIEKKNFYELLIDFYGFYEIFLFYVQLMKISFLGSRKFKELCLNFSLIREENKFSFPVSQGGL